MNPAALTLAGIFAIAAGRKARGMPTSMLRAFRDLSLPAPLMRPAAAWAHLLIQCLAIVLLLIPATSRIGALLGGLLATAYLVVMARARDGKCRCLSEKARPIDSQTLLRGVLLIALAGAAFAGSSGPIGWAASLGLFAVILLL